MKQRIEAGGAAKVNAGKNAKSRQVIPTIQPVHRTYITPKEGVHGRMKPDLFESFLDYKYNEKYQKTSSVAVDPMLGQIEGYGDELKEMFQETEVRSRAVAGIMVLQIAKEREKMMEVEVKKAMDIILDRADEDGKKRERDDVLTYGGMGIFSLLQYKRILQQQYIIKLQQLKQSPMTYTRHNRKMLRSW